MKGVCLLVMFIMESWSMELFDLRKIPVKLSLEEQMAILKERRTDCELRKLADPPPDGVYCNVTWDNAMCWDFTPADSVAWQPCPSYISGFKTLGNATRHCLADGTWKTNDSVNNTAGWTNYTDCMGGKPPQPPVDYSHHFTNIQTMSEVGYGLSLVSLLVAVGIMIAFRRLHCKSNVLHINLFLSFILRASVAFLKVLLFVDDLGLEKDIIRRDDGTIRFKPEGLHWECKLVVTIFMYSVAASVMWIFMEGLYLHMLVHKTMFTERHGTRIYVLCGWLSPILYLVPWVIVRIYLENELCWNQHRVDEYFWIIKAPLQLSIVINFIFFINIVRFLFTRANANRHVKDDAQRLRKTGKFVLVLIPLFGVLYVAFAAFPHGVSIQADIVYLYCEMFYNSFQGFLLALLFCFLNEEVQNEIKHCWHRRKFNNLHTRSILMSSWRKTSRTYADHSTRDTRLTESHTNTGEPNKPHIKCLEHVTSWKRTVANSDTDNRKVTSSWCDTPEEENALMQTTKQ